MSVITATTLQQFIGMDDYEKRLAIDRIARELGISSAAIEAEINDFERDGFSSKNDIVQSEIPEAKSNFTENQESKKALLNS